MSDVRLVCGGEQGVPASFLGNPEDVLGDVLVAVLEDFRSLLSFLRVEIAALFVSSSLEDSAAPLERIRDVLEEDEAEYQVLVFGGLDATAQPIACLPELLRKGKIVILSAVRPVPRS